MKLMKLSESLFAQLEEQIKETDSIVHFPKFRPVKSRILDRAQRGY